MEFFFLDLLVFISVLIATIKTDKLTFYHPMTWFLFFHFYMVTFRMYQLFILDLPTLSYYNSPPTLDEISFACFLADLGLIFIYLGFLLAKYKRKKVYNFHTINKKYFYTILAISVVVGLISMSKFIFVPFIDNGFELQEKSLLFYANSWLVYSFLILIYVRGFKKIYVYSFILLTLLYAFQGESRFRLILPLIFLLSIYLKSKNMKWPKWQYMVIGLVFFVFVFSPLKRIGVLLQTGADSTIIFEEITKSYEYTNSGKNGELMFLDMYATVVALIDNSYNVYFGETYLSVIYMFIPRSIWESKPILTQWLYDISSTNRNIGELGQIPSIFGESYANFRIFGVCIIPFLCSLFYSKFYFKIINSKHNSAELLLYLVFLSIIVQVLRDGLISLFLFTFINFFPVTILAILSIYKKKYN
jgi:oligosaccharide repeat unit polymerase